MITRHPSIRRAGPGARLVRASRLSGRGAALALQRSCGMAAVAPHL